MMARTATHSRLVPFNLQCGISCWSVEFGYFVITERQSKARRHHPRCKKSDTLYFAEHSSSTILMASFELNPIETRILGCLLEKERTTPDAYPLTLNSLTAACNQTTNREPIVTWDDKAVEEGVNSLREKKLATVVFGAGSRVQKYRHDLLEHFNLERQDLALLCVLMLRGPQTLGELRTRSERIYSFHTLHDVESSLEELSKGDFPLVKVLPARPGQKERRYVQLLSTEATTEDSFAHEPAISQTRGISPEAARIQSLEEELTGVKNTLQELREEFALFRKQFE
jgi:uncharacterized protein YceH (UPF0502 family)